MKWLNALGVLLVLSGCVTGMPIDGPVAGCAPPVVALSGPDADDMVWYDVQALRSVEGAGWPEGAVCYGRLPRRAQGVVREPVWALSQDSSGMSVGFVTDALEIALRWELRDGKQAVEHMAKSGVSGFDLYARHGATWDWVGLARPTSAGEMQDETIIKKIPAGEHEYRLYFPLYNGVKSVSIGVNAGAVMRAGPARGAPHGKPMVFYGTSITQGASASRPGMAYPAMLGRRLDRPTVNLGFAGNGTMDLEMADLLGEIDASVYVLDCLPNMSREMVAERAAAFVKKLRAARPEVPVVMVESITPRNAWFLTWQGEEADAKNAVLRSVLAELKLEGMKKIYLVPGAQLLGPTTESAVDGLHATDLGFTFIANAIEPVLRKALRGH